MSPEELAMHRSSVEGMTTLVAIDLVICAEAVHADDPVLEMALLEQAQAIRQAQKMIDRAWSDHQMRNQ
jgi:hypothetical protein